MSKVFMITEGLENMGALKTGGQGSVYKGKRVGEIITAVKILPTPIHSESAEDKNYLDFQNEVEKLKRVNEVPNPNVVKILSSGITETGSFPFIEMEFVEGPDLEELLKPPHDPIYSIKGAIKIAEQLANAIAHCHKVDVKHGDIKSNNVKYNVHTANYVLLDFGMAVMSDEQRRTSLRHAGAIEFMAPEQNEGLILYETDVYSYGIILFELLAGTVPFPLSDKGETSRNHVMVAHMDTPVPDLMHLRRERMPHQWENDKKRKEMQVPHWLLDMIYKCLEKRPEHRFQNGMMLQEYIQLNNSLAAKKEEADANYILMLEQENERLLAENDRMQGTLLEQSKQFEPQNKQSKSASIVTIDRDDDIAESRSFGHNTKKQKTVPVSYFLVLLLITLGIGFFAAISFLKNDDRQIANNSNSIDTTSTLRQDDERFAESDDSNSQELATPPGLSPDAKKERETKPSPKQSIEKPGKLPTKQQQEEVPSQGANESIEDKGSLGKYKLAGRRVYFHNEPDENTRRNAFIVHWNNATLTALDEKNDFIYVVFINHLGQTSKGWLPKKDLKPVE